MHHSTIRLFTRRFPIVILILIVGLTTGAGILHSQTNAQDVFSRQFQVSFVEGFSIDGGVPNAALVEDEQGQPVVVLLYLNEGLYQVQSTDGVHFEPATSRFVELPRLFQSSGIMPVGVIVRQTTDGTWRYFFKGLRPPDASDENRFVYAVDYEPGGTLTPVNEGQPVYQGEGDEPNRVEVIDIIETLDGDWRMFYIALDHIPGLAETAISSDEGLTWTFEARNPFGDSETETRADQINVDPAPFRLNDGTYMAVTMRAGRLYFWNSVDGLYFEQVDDFAVSVQDAAGVANGEWNGLFDPTLVQLPDDTLYLYVTAGSHAAGEILLAEVIIEE